MASRDLGALTGPLAGAAFVGSVGGSIKLAGGPPPRPGSAPQDVRKWYDASPKAGRVSALGQALSLLSVAGFTASVAKLARRSGSRALRAAAVAGGTATVASLATSAACTAALTTDRRADDDTAVRLNDTAFAAGGPVHGVGFGLLTGSLSLAGLRTGELPKPVAIAGLVSAAASVLSPVYFATEKAALLIPLGRFSGLLVGGIAGARLGLRR
ncbi:MAG TPA: hypothetical protein VH969_30680 [Actinophytocola sp.]|jgi:hypothetical protein|uniref:hypothetical protein n=1 Tax=Actinophytocola sp. TaxID=1872138 RepID=UPI002F93B079